MLGKPTAFHGRKFIGKYGPISTSSNAAYARISFIYQKWGTANPIKARLN